MSQRRQHDAARHGVRSGWRHGLRAVLLLLAPCGWIVLTDVLRRGDHLASYDALHVYAYLATAVASALLWGVLLYAAALTKGRFRQLAAGLFVLLFGVSVGVQSAFFEAFHIYLSQDCQMYAQSLPQAALGYLPLSRPALLLRLLGTLLLALGFVVAARRLLAPGKWSARVVMVLTPLVLFGVTRIPASYRVWQSTTPDIIYFHGLVIHIKERLYITDDAPELRVQRRRPVALPRVVAKPARPRNVLFILQESLRADVVCNEYEPNPKTCATPFSNRAVPHRYPLQQLRANASTTAISISNLWSGVGAHEGYDTLLSVPLLWDYAAAAGIDGAYWTSQNVMFGSMRLYVQDLPVSHRAYATHLDPNANFDAGANDALLTTRVIAEWDELQEPFFAVVHYSNVHHPYVYDKKYAPFQPALFDKAAGKNEAFFNYYKDVAYLSDMAVGRLLEHVRNSSSGPRTVIVYTSDHGEAFREHWQLGHTSSLYDEEIKVPGWIDAPEGTLSEEELAAVVGAKNAFTWHYDLAPTMLDLMGLWDVSALQPQLRKMLGTPLTRPLPDARPLPLNNCSWLWECGFRNWGLMQGRLKLEAREWDDEYHCFDVLADPEERFNLGEAACQPLPTMAREMLGPMPFEDWPRNKELLWGPAPAASGKP